MTRVRTAGLLAGLALAAGCGTLTQGHMPPGPAIFGGLRLDIDILGHDHVPAGSKAMAVLDMIPSLAFDAAFLLFSIPNEIIAGGIDVEAPPNWDNPPPKYAGYSAPPDRKIQADRATKELHEEAAPTQ